MSSLKYNISIHNKILPKSLAMATNIQENIPEIVPYDTIAHFDRIAARITDTLNGLIDQLIERRDTLCQVVAHLRDDFHNKESTRVAAIEELDQTQLHLNQMSKLNINLPAHEQAGLVYEQYKQQLCVPTPLPNLSFSCPTLSLLQTQIEQFGEVVQLEAPHYSQKTQPILTAGTERKGDKQLYGTGLSLDEVNEKVYIADCGNHRVQAFQGEFLSHFGEEVLYRPWGISVTDNHIIVTNCWYHTLFQFCKNSHQLLNRAGGYGNNEGQLYYPRGLSVDWNGYVFVADQWNNRVSVFSNLLHYKQTIGQGSLSYPQDVKLATDKVVVLDRSPNCIHFFSRSGDLLTSCVSRGEDQGYLVWNPYFFCLDSEQNILVSDWGHHAIKILSNSGELLHTIGREGNGKGEFIRPCGIAISNSGILFVLSDNPNYCLQLF